MRFATVMISAATIAALTFLCMPALADWDEGDDYKMHYPQLPDPFGWDVYADATDVWGGPGLVADDWECSQSGPVSDIHIWGSWSDDLIDDITSVHVEIYADIPADPGGTGPELFSKPGALLWDRDFSASDITVRADYPPGNQGFYIPSEDGPKGVWPEDHERFHQINIDYIEDPFVQERDTIYWLGIQVAHPDEYARWGWKTSLDHFQDDAVWWDGVGWQELYDPLTGESLDMAFVITTPEPGTMVMSLLAGLGLLFYGKRRWRRE